MVWAGARAAQARIRTRLDRTSLLSANVDTIVAEGDANGSGYAAAERRRGPEFGEQQVVLNLPAQFVVLLAGRAHDVKADDLALVVELQIHHGIMVGESDRSGAF